MWHRIHHIYFFGVLFCFNGTFYFKTKQKIKQKEMNFRLHDFFFVCSFLCVFWYFKCEKKTHTLKFGCVAGSGLSTTSQQREKHKNAVASNNKKKTHIQEHDYEMKKRKEEKYMLMVVVDVVVCFLFLFFSLLLNVLVFNIKYYTSAQPTRKVPTHRQ